MVSYKNKFSSIENSNCFSDVWNGQITKLIKLTILFKTLTKTTNNIKLGS